MTQRHVSSVTEALLQARRSGQPADAHPLAHALPDAEAAYAVQQAVVLALTGQSDMPRHWKSGGPARDAVLTHAPLPPAGVWASPATAGNGPFEAPSIEAEVALRLAVPLDAAMAADLMPESVDPLIDAMAVSIEVVDSRWQQAADAAPLLRLADLQSHGALVLGAWAPLPAARLGGADVPRPHRHTAGHRASGHPLAG